MVNLTESATKLKSVICTIGLPLVNTSSPDQTAAAFISFCSSTNAAFEVAINTLSKVLIELMTSRPEELAKLAEKAVSFFDQMQKEPLLWESFLALPEMFNPKSPEQLLGNLGKLLKSLQLVLTLTERNFPEVKANMLSVHPFVAAGISVTQYMQHWPGKTVSIRFGDVVVENETLWQMVGDIEIPLDKALALAFDRNMVRDCVCKNSSNLMLIAACATGTLDMFLDWISPNKLAQQIILTWSKSVAPHDLALVKGLLHSLGGVFEGSGMSRETRSIQGQPQNIEEELFLEVGKVVMEILKLSPEADAVVQQILRAGFQSMSAGTQAIVTVKEMMENLVKDVTTIKMVVQTLLTNQSQTTLWMNQAFNSVIQIIVKILADEPLTCDKILVEFECFFSINTVKREVWQSFFCGNTTMIEQTLLSDWMPLKEKALALYDVFLGDASYNVTLPMILSEWHKLYNNSLNFGTFVERLSEEWGEADWMVWVPTNSSAYHLTASLEQSVTFLVLNLGQKFEQSQLWPEAKSYFYMANWILNYRAGVTMQPDCSMNMKTFAIECIVDFNWQQFVGSLSQALMSPTEELLINSLKGSVQLLQHVYGNFYKYQAASYLNKGIEGGDMLSAFLSNMLNEMNDFVSALTRLPDTNPQVMVPLYQKLLESTGLKPLLPLILSNGPVNISEVFEVASQLGRSNQGIFTFNESDPAMAELEDYIMQFLSLEGNLSMSVYLGMSHSLLTYSSYFSPEYVAKVKEAIQPFTNQTSSGIVEAILSAIELLQTITDSPNGDPTHVILGYIHQLQEFVVSLFRMQRIEQIKLPNGQVSPVQVAQLHLLADIFDLLSPEGIMNLTQVGPVAAQHIIIQKYIQTLPAQVRPEAAEFLDGFVALQSQLAQCESGEDCMAEISEVFDFLDQILEMTLNANGNATLNIAATSMYMGRKQYMPVASAFLSLLLKPKEAEYVRIVQETFQFISILLDQTNITVGDVQEALSQVNLSIEELNTFVAQLGALNVNDLIKKLGKLLNAQKCFEQQTSPMLLTYCAVETVNSINGFLMHLPALQNETFILSMIPVILNKTVTDMINTNFTSHPQNAVAEVLHAALSNVKMTLHQNNLSSPEIVNEMKVLESLVKLIANPEPLMYLNIPLNEFNAGSAQLKMVLWYLERLENVTSSSSVSQLFYPVFGITQMQVALALAQIDMNQFVGQQILNLTKSLQYPIDADGVSKIGHTTIEILQHVIKFVVLSLEAQNEQSFIFGYDAPINMTCVNATVLQMNNYIKLLQQWMIQANFGAWGNLNNSSITVKDISHLLQSTLNFFNLGLQNYTNAIGDIPQALNKAIMLAEQLNGLQSNQFLGAILEAVKSVMQLVSQQTGPVPLSVQESVLDVVKNVVWLAVHPESSYALALNTTLDTLQELEFIINQVLPPEVTQYLHAALKVVATYFQSVATVYGPDSWNELILNEMETIENFLPQNSTAQFYVSTIINVTKSILQSTQGNTSLWSLGSSEESIPYIFAEMVKLLNMFCPLIMGESCALPNASSVNGFADLPVVLEKLMTNMANNETLMLQMNNYIKLLQQWMIQANFGAWGNLNNTSNTVKDISHLLQSTLNFFNLGLQNYTNAIGDIPQALNKAIMLAEQLNGLQSNQFLGAILEAVKSVMQLVSQQTGPVPLSVQESVLDVVKNVVWLAVHPESSYALALNTTLDTLQELEFIINQVLPPEVAQYLHAALKVVATYFQSVATVYGPDSWNELILNEMETIENFLPQNSTAQFYVSTIINVTKSILQSTQGNTSLWSLGSSEESIPYIFAEMVKLLNMFCPLIMGESCALPNASSVNGFADLPVVLEELMTNMANNETLMLQMNNYITLLQQWMIQANFGALGNLNNTSNTVKDISHLLQSTLNLFDLGLQNYTNAIGNIIQALNKAIMLAEQLNGLQSNQFLGAILEAVKSVMQLVSQQTGPVPLSVQESVLDVVKNVVWLAVHPESSYALALNTTLDTLQELEFIINQVLPPEVAQYLHAALKVVATYFQSVATVYGPDSWNELILNEMETIENFLPQNSTAQFYVSTIINVTKSILQSTQGNTSLWSLGSSEESIPYIFAEIVKLLNMFCPLIMGESCALPNASSVNGFADLPVVLEELFTYRANNETWMKLQKMVELLMTFFVEPEMSNNLACAVEMIEKENRDEVKNVKAETGENSSTKPMLFYIVLLTISVE
ncbi:uncharacterized protein [Eucyclogobius newberryi]|uniref:uncharacterized protein n=1 Tax=Eucyclogobius newberryi TaxID=166745 RepID=UPI003B5CF3FC